MVTARNTRFALVTGAGGGIGGAIAARLAGEGFGVALVDRDLPDDLAAAIGAAGASDVLAVRADLSDPAATVAAYDTSLDRFGAIDALVNVAGMMIFKPIAAHGAEDWARLLAVNLVAPALLTGRALETMRDGGAIVNIASVHARRTSADVASYAASKAALVSLTRSAAIEGRARGIRCNAILPGAIDTAMLRTSPNIVSGKEVVDPADIGQPADIGALTAFLLSAEARFITGEDIVADGGRMGRL